MEIFNSDLITCPIARGSKETPNALAIQEDQVCYSYQSLDTLIKKTCFAVLEMDLSPETIVAFPANRDTKTIVLFFALLRLGRTVCPLNPKLPQVAIDLYLKEFTSAVFLKPEEISLPSNQTKDEEILSKKTALLLFTSGSSGLPKIAALSVENLLSNALGFENRLLLNGKSRWLLSLPLFHVSGIGILFRMFLTRASVVISSNTLEMVLVQENISHLSLVPTQLYRLPKRSFTSLKAILLGGAPIPEHLYQEYHSLTPLFPTYGMTEMGSTITVNEDKTYSPHLGKCLPGREIKISSKGEIFVKGTTLFQGYYTKNGITRHLDNEGFFATSDLGSYQDGNLSFHGRKDLMFISGGENIHPEEIEKHLYNIKGVELAIVVPVSNPEFGMRPVVFLKNETLDHQKIRQELEKVLPKFKVPTHSFTFPEFQELKPSRSILKKLAEDYLKDE